MNLGQSIKSIRKKKNLGQKEIAEKCGISINSLSQIETNSTFPHKQTIEKLAEVLEVPLSYILFLSITEEDIPEEKKVVFNSLNSAVKSIIIDSI